MTAARGSDEWERAVTEAQAEQHRLDVVHGVLFDMWLAASKSRIRTDFRRCEVEHAKSVPYEELGDVVWAERTAASDHVNELLGGSEFVERVRQARARARAEIERLR
ncbi:hypothetical protein [Nocardia sp. NPDC002869]|uniref:hypothetical protein n=1 Tax=Nocardia sp. NPDC002869 TaxID=3161032 RepID=UPI00398D457D